MLRRTLGAWLLLLALAGRAGAAPDVEIDFDGFTGRGGPFFGACEAEFQIHDEYLGLGVRFESDDSAVCLLAPGNAPSPPNVVTGISGGDIDFEAAVIATFLDGGSPRAVGLVLLTLTDSTSSNTLVEAYDENGVLLGNSGKSGPGTHILDFPRLIHEVRVDQGAFAVDDFRFSTPGVPMAVPALGVLGQLGLIACLAAAGARRLRS